MCQLPPLKTFVSVLVLALFVAGCNASSGDAATSTAPHRASETSASDEHHASEAHATADAPHAEGSRFDPPRPIGEMSAGMWVCDMGGNVHYAASEPGDGRCPVCGMSLTQVSGAASAP